MFWNITVFYWIQPLHGIFYLFIRYDFIRTILKIWIVQGLASAHRPVSTNSVYFQCGITPVQLSNRQFRLFKVGLTYLSIVSVLPIVNCSPSAPSLKSRPKHGSKATTCCGQGQQKNCFFYIKMAHLTKKKSMRWSDNVVPRKGAVWKQGNAAKGLSVCNTN